MNYKCSMFAWIIYINYVFIIMTYYNICHSMLLKKHEFVYKYSILLLLSI